MYTDQDRGNSTDYARYLAGMDAIVVEKVASASAYFFEKPGHAIVDVGMASGMSTYILALLYPGTRIIGVDINPTMVALARQKYQLANLEFLVDDGETLTELTDVKICGFFNCSSIHHITSFNDYQPHKAYLTLKRQADLLCEGGILVVRDFSKPDAQVVVLEFPDTPQGHYDAGLLKRFSTTARSLARDEERGFPLEEVAASGQGPRFRLQLADAVEFIRRKDYLADWDVELQEEYGYFTQADFEAVFANLGLRTIVSQPVYNDWIIRHRYLQHFELYDAAGRKLGVPATNYVIAGEKVAGVGTKLKTVRQLPLQDRCFLSLKTYQNTTSGELYEVAQRPGAVVDLLPYFHAADGRLRIVAKHGYPRPIVHQITPVLDGKTYSGYLTEGITGLVAHAPDDQLIQETLVQRAHIPAASIAGVHRGLTYYTSPGAINEKVEAVSVQLSGLEPSGPNDLGTFSGFKTSGVIRSYDALQLIQSAQVGALPEARLEMNIYHLLHQLQIHPGKWLNAPITLSTVDHLTTTTPEDMALAASHPFEATSQSVGFLRHHRTKYYEYGQADSAAVFEHIEPLAFSCNTVITLPVVQYRNQVYVGIEKRHLPVPQLQEGNSLLWAAPAYRVPREVTNRFELQTFIQEKVIFGSKVVSSSRLGEKYLPCIGVTPEQVYPYVVTLDRPSPDLYWMALDDLMHRTAQLRDGHLLICLFRLAHYISYELR